MFLICLIFQYLDNKYIKTLWRLSVSNKHLHFYLYRFLDIKYIKTLLNSNKILTENLKPISGIKLEIIG